MSVQTNDILKLIYAAIMKHKMELSAHFSIKSTLPIITLSLCVIMGQLNAELIRTPWKCKICLIMYANMLT